MARPARSKLPARIDSSLDNSTGHRLSIAFVKQWRCVERKSSTRLPLVPFSRASEVELILVASDYLTGQGVLEEASRSAAQFVAIFAEPQHLRGFIVVDAAAHLNLLARLAGKGAFG